MQAEVCVKCNECNTDLDIHRTEIKYGDYYLLVPPCEVCLEEAREEVAKEFE